MESQSAFDHLPVMLGPVLELLGCRSGGRYVDGTLGGGGYAEGILRASMPDGVLLGLDWDGDAIERAKERLSSYGRRVLLEQASFADLPKILQGLAWDAVDGIVLDLGVSSYQLDDPERGFSFLRDGPLDMRMNKDLPTTAADLVNSLSEEDLANLIFQLGEERWSRRIARAIAAERKKTSFHRTRQLAELIESVVPRTRDSRRIHPATRSFQALRLAVNQEPDALNGFLTSVLEVLKPGGRLCVVAFHSLEDRMVKEAFRNWSRACRCPRNVVPCRCEGKPLVKLLARKALRPDSEEVAGNPRARSARLRAVERL